MATNYTNLLGFALPTTGELSGTWGQVVNDSITELVEDSIAGTATASVTSGDWTLSTTGSGAANEARCAILIPTGTPGTSRNIIAPSSSKAYIVDNQSNGAVVVKGSATTGTTIAAGAKAVVAWNGSDFITISTSSTDGVATISFGSTGLTPNTATSGAVTVGGTLAIANGGTGATSDSGARTSLGATTLGSNLFTITNPSAITFPRFNADNSVSALNAADFRTAIGAGTGGGDVTGPASSTDNALVRFDSTTGKLIQNSGAILDDSGNLGLGATPSATSATGYRALELGTTAGTGITAGNGDLYIPVNAYVSGGAWKYATTAAATLFNATGSVYTWSTATSGTADTNITFTQRLAITAAGFLQPTAYADTVVALGNTGTAINVNMQAGNVFTATLTGSCTFTLQNPIATGASSFTLVLTNDGTAGRTVAWAGGSFVFPGGASTLSRTTTANATDVWAFFTPNGGTTWYGNIVMKDVKA